MLDHIPTVQAFSNVMSGMVFILISRVCSDHYTIDVDFRDCL